MNGFRIIAILSVAAVVGFTAVAFSEEPPTFHGSSMYIPWSDFKEILDKLTTKPPEEVIPPPIDALVADAEYVATVGKEKVIVTVKATVVVLEPKGWSKPAILHSGVPITAISLDGKPAALTVEGDQLMLVLDKPGTHELKLTYEVALATDNGPEQFTLPTLLAPVNRIEVRLPSPDQVVTFTPGGVARSEEKGQNTVAFGSFPLSGSVEVSWLRRAPKAEKEEARVSAVVRTLLTVGEGFSSYSSVIEYDIKHKPKSSFAIRLPEDVTVADVTTEGLVDWSIEKKDGAQLLFVSIAYETLGKHQINVTYEKPLPAGETATFHSAEIIVEDVVHETGFMGVAVRTNVQVSAEKVENLVSINVGELPEDLRSVENRTVLLAFKYVKHPSGADLKVVKHADASVLACAVETALYRIMLTETGKELIEATYRVTNRSRQYLTLTLPPDTDLWSVFRDDQPVKAAEDKGKFLLPIFKGGLDVTLTLKVLAYRKANAFHAVGHQAIDLPSLDVGTNMQTLEIYLPRKYQYGLFGGKLEQVETTRQDWTLSYEDKKKTAAAKDMNIGSNSYSNRLEDLLAAQVENDSYRGAMGRGMLPVTVKVEWDGIPFRFAARIVDPGEINRLTFLYSRVTDCAFILLVMQLSAIFLGYMLIKFILAWKTSYFPRPQRRYFFIGAGVLIAVAFIAFSTPSWIMGVVSGFIFGAAVMFARFLWKWRAAHPGLSITIPFRRKAGAAFAGVSTPEKSAESALTPALSQREREVAAHEKSAEPVANEGGVPEVKGDSKDEKGGAL